MEERSIYLTGDIHGDARRFNSLWFPEQKELTREDFVIVLGDFGLVWDYEGESKQEKYWLDWLEDKNFTLLFVDGNHENYDRLNSNEFTEVDFHGGKAHKIRDNVYHLERGYVFNLQGKKFFAFGGASSHDVRDGILDPSDFKNKDDFWDAAHNWYKRCKEFRIKGMSWWEQELPSEEEMNRGIENLALNDWKVDYVITHCLPQEMASVVSQGIYESDKLTMYFNGLLQRGLDFDFWWCGHYHRNDRVMSKFNILYEDIVRLI